jgi:hypothetical protein
VTVQARRHELALILGAWMEEDGWTVTEATRPLVASRTVAVGHARSIVPASLDAYRADLQLSLWVNEGDDDESVDELYARLSPGEKSIQFFLTNHPTFTIADGVTVGGVAAREEGPTTFLVASLIVPVMVRET